MNLDKNERRMVISVKNSSKLLEPPILFGNLTKLSHLDKSLADFTIAKLNEYLHSQIINTIGSASSLITGTLQHLVTKIDYQKVKDSELLFVIKQKILSEIKQGNNGTLIKEGEEVEQRLSNMPATKIADLLHLDVPLRENPIFNSEIRTAKIREYAKVAKLDEVTVKKLIDRNVSLF